MSLCSAVLPIRPSPRERSVPAWALLCPIELRTCVIITCLPNELLASIHDRMPVILDPKKYKSWLHPEEVTSDKLLPMLTPFPAGKMWTQEGSRAVNSPRNDSPACIEPVSKDLPTLFG